MHLLNRGKGFQFFGVDHRRHPVQRHRAAGVAGAAAARDDGELERDTCAHQMCDLGFGVGMQHDKRILHAPVGGVGDMRNPRQAVKLDIVAARNFA